VQILYRFRLSLYDSLQGAQDQLLHITSGPLSVPSLEYQGYLSLLKQRVRLIRAKS
jgi:hypothetical protein